MLFFHLLFNNHHVDDSPKCFNKLNCFAIKVTKLKKVFENILSILLFWENLYLDHIVLPVNIFRINFKDDGSDNLLRSVTSQNVTSKKNYL